MDTSPENNSSVLSTFWRSNLQCRLQENAEARQCVPRPRDKSEERGQIQPLCSRREKNIMTLQLQPTGEDPSNISEREHACEYTLMWWHDCSARRITVTAATRAHLHSFVFLSGIPTYIPLWRREPLRDWSISLLKCWDLHQQDQHASLFCFAFSY